MTGRPGEPYCAGVLTLSDKGSRGEREDTSGPLLQEMLQGAGFTVAAYEVIPDQEELIVTTLEQWSDALHLDLIVTTGGTGVAPTDRTPEATRRVIATEVPGLAEAMRQASLAKTVQAVWSRGIAGIRGTCQPMPSDMIPFSYRPSLSIIRSLACTWTMRPPNSRMNRSGSIICHTRWLGSKFIPTPSPQLSKMRRQIFGE